MEEMPHVCGHEIGERDNGSAVVGIEKTPTPFSLDGDITLLSSNVVSPTEKESVLHFEKKHSPESSDAALLLSVAAIATKEVHIDGAFSSDVNSKRPPKISIPSFEYSDDQEHSDDMKAKSTTLTPRFSRLCSVFEEEYQHEMQTEREAHRQQTSNFEKRIRAVSIDSPNRDANMYTAEYEYHENMDYDPSLPQVSPPSSPMITSRPRLGVRKPSGLAGKNNICRQRSNSTTDSSESGSKRPLQPPTLLKKHLVKTILKKKFSWKNHPELEAFLVANREEYLRHSALNYTVQQKQYNNRLTERLLELAAEHGYVFDENDFSFVTVRDRIRCYYKSYVQSSKKRGVIIGYAARRAGLLSQEDLEKSAGIEGRIVTPTA